MSTWIVREDVSGPGLRVAVKDLIDVAGLPTTAGSLAVADRASPALADAACLAGLRTAISRREAVLAGKVNLHELAYGISGVNAAFGTPVNPLDPRRVPGGSSSGSAVVVATGEADVAFGSDSGGSVRIPAACCGVAGLKTTGGRIPLAGVWPLAPSMDTVGPLARDVSGLAAGMALLEPGFTVASDPPQTVGRVAMDADPVIDAAVDAALASAGWRIAPVALPGLTAAMAAAMIVIDAEAWQSDGALAAAAPGRIGRDVLRRLRKSSKITPAALAAAHRAGSAWRAALDGVWERVEMLAVPTLLGFPPVLGDARGLARIRGLTSPVNLAGLPALVLPVRAAGPLPASVQLIGPLGSEERLLAAGYVLERAAQELPARGGRRSAAATGGAPGRSPPGGVTRQAGPGPAGHQAQVRLTSQAVPRRGHGACPAPAGRGG
jgi:amidase